jgi:hypothetical protein
MKGKAKPAGSRVKHTSKQRSSGYKGGSATAPSASMKGTGAMAGGAKGKASERP